MFRKIRFGSKDKWLEVGALQGYGIQKLSRIRFSARIGLRSWQLSGAPDPRQFVGRAFWRE
jgi:hypothetical protein